MTIMWTEMEASAATEAVKAHFNQAAPAGIRLSAVLQGKSPGLLWTDDDSRPSWAIVQEKNYGTLYVGGAPGKDTLRALIDARRRQGEVLVGVWPDDPNFDLLPTDFEYDGLAIDFTERDSAVSLEALVANGADGRGLRRMDAELLSRSLDRDSLVTTYGSPDKTLQACLGYFLMQGDEILCESITGPVIDGKVEMGVNTPEPFRRRGYATATCARVVQECEGRGWQTYWNCAGQNTASVALARRLGYRKEQEYRVLAWFPPKDR